MMVRQRSRNRHRPPALFGLRSAGSRRPGASAGDVELSEHAGGAVVDLGVGLLSGRRGITGIAGR
jgi:hypothetical protein